MNRAAFALVEPPVDAIDFVLTAKERSFAAWARVHIERQRRERNRLDESRGPLADLAGETA